MFQEDFLPAVEGMNSDTVATLHLGKRKELPTASAAKNHLLGPICPICSKALGPSTSNQGLNDHVDWCLNKDAISSASKRTPKKAKGSGGDSTAKRKPESSTAKKKGDGKSAMMGWLKKDI